ncbi:hypothetical protein DFQ27_002864 [Actinomortierella ambigua]|uniref:Uncharacterized protein n=1 Tax=Actinomortierella ambigua TaxID=1343610 RepID=A0A9P6Q7G1_9FUNG|nr:hypothetical protein DFQ26_009724 [Actinomortierella ambigua]KAG0261629.1 hypothetical protein DFQ27_002864 [Actinomortierella ambigua]
MVGVVVGTANEPISPISPTDPTAPMPLTRPPPAMLNNRSDPIPFASSMAPTTTFTLQTSGVFSPKIKCTSDIRGLSYTFQSRSDPPTRNMTLKDASGSQVCKVKNKGEHLLDLNLTTESKDINVQFRDMVAFKKAVEKNSRQLSSGGRMPQHHHHHHHHHQQQQYHVTHTSLDEDDDRTERMIPEPMGRNGTCWAFEFEGKIYQWTAGGGHGIHAPPGLDILVCHSTSSCPPTRIAKVQNHTGSADRLTIYNGPTASATDKTGLQILLLTSVLSLLEIMNDASPDLVDFD